MKFKREFKKDYKKKLATGGFSDPPDDYDFGSMSYANIRKGYESGNIPMDSIKKQYPLFAADLKNPKMNMAYKIGDWFGSIPTKNNPGGKNPTGYETLAKKKSTPKSNANLLPNPSGKSPGYNSMPTPYLSPVTQFSNYLDGLGQGTMEENSTSIPQKPKSSSKGEGGQSNSVATSPEPQNNSQPSSSTAESDQSFDLNIEGASLPNSGIDAPDTEIESVATNPVSDEVGEVDGVGRKKSGGSNTNDFLQYLPDAINFASGVFGKDETKAPTQVNNRAVNMMPDSVNVNPQLNEARKSYQAIISDPNASPNQKLAAQAQLNNMTSKIYAQKQNQENRLKANKASIQANLDAQQARYNETHRQDKMASEANLGLDGNYARQALASASQKFLQNKAMDNKKAQTDNELMTIISSYPKAVQKRILEQLDLNG